MISIYFCSFCALQLPKMFLHKKVTQLGNAFLLAKTLKRSLIAAPPTVSLQNILQSKQSAIKVIESLKPMSLCAFTLLPLDGAYPLSKSKVFVKRHLLVELVSKDVRKLISTQVQKYN